MPHRAEKVASEVMGIAKGAKAQVEGVHGVFQHLMREHGEVTALLLRVKASSDPKVRSEFFPLIRQELLSHEKGEVTDVYPAFAAHPELAEFAEEHEEDTSELEESIDLVTETPYDDERWSARFAELVDVVSAHVEKEESEYFPTASRVIGREQSEAMLARFEATKAKAKNAS
jgi:hemerythrin superfamily protein